MDSRSYIWIISQCLSLLFYTARICGASVLIVQDGSSGLSGNLNIINTDAEADTQVFRGILDDTTDDTFSLPLLVNNRNAFYNFYIENDYMLLSSRNIVFNVSLVDFKENRRITWPPALDDIELCLLRQKSRAECQNYIRVIERRNEDELMICGTNAYRPLCRTYKELEKGPVQKDEESGIARCPFDPQHNSTAVLYDGRLYAATVADLSGRDSLIYSGPLRSEQHDSQWLNDPDFVSSFGHKNRVYFFFRETAVENINCGKAVFSRVARVCTNDAGGARVLRNTWTTFSKARLNCSIPGDFPFYFDELQSTTSLGIGNVFPTLVRKNGVEMIYAVFSTPRNSLRGSAVCAFRMSDIVDSFEGAYKEQKSAHYNWLPVKESEIPEPHPGLNCPNASHSLSDQTLNFIKSHPLMDKAVPAYSGQPIIVQASFNFSFTQIAVDWQVYAADRRYYDVLFIGTDDGKVYKMINKGWGKNVETVLIEAMQVFEDGSPVTRLTVYRDERYKQAKLVVASDNEVRSLALARCHIKTSCSDCMALRDPYCSWIDDKCADSFYGIQSIETGRHAQCPADKTTKHTTSSSSTTETPMITCPPCLTNQIAPDKRLDNEDVTESKNEVKLMPTLRHASKLNSSEKTKGSSEEDTQNNSIASKNDHSSDDSTIRGAAATTLDHRRYGAEFFVPIIVSCILVALIVGFTAGYCVAIRMYIPHHAATYRVMNKDCEVTFNAPSGNASLSSHLIGSGGTGKSVENQYEPEPVNLNKWPALENNKKQTNVFVNELKSRTSERANNIETSLQRNKNIHKGASDV